MASDTYDFEIAQLLFKKDEVIERLVKENAASRTRLEALQYMIAASYTDADHMSLEANVELLMGRVTLLESLLRDSKIKIPEWS